MTTRTLPQPARPRDSIDWHAHAIRWQRIADNHHDPVIRAQALKHAQFCERQIMTDAALRMGRVTRLKIG